MPRSSAASSSSSASASVDDGMPFDYGLEATSGGAARLLLCLPAMNHLAVDSRRYGYVPADDARALYRARVLPHLARRRSIVRYTLTHHECMAGHDIFAAVARVVLGLRIFASDERDTARYTLVFVAQRAVTVVDAAKALRDTCERSRMPATTRIDARGVSRLMLCHGRVSVLFAAARVDTVATVDRLAVRIDTLVVHAPETMSEAARDAVTQSLARRAHTQFVLTAVRRPPPQLARRKTRRRVKVHH